MEMKDIQYFLEVANHKSFTKAAAHSFISQPTLSKSIRKLEGELNVELFERSTRNLKLTDAGELVYKQGLKIVGVTKELTTQLEDLRSLPTGEIKIGIPPLIGTLLFPSIAKYFGKRYPKISLELVELGAKRIEQLVEAGQVDIGIIVLPTANSKFTVSPFIEEPFMLYTHTKHPLANKELVELPQLHGENFILFNKDFALHHLIIKHCQNAGFDPVIAYESSQWDLITELVIEQLGVTLLPASIYSKMNHRLIKRVPIQSPPMWELAIITKNDSYLSFAVRTMLQYLLEDFRE